MVEGTARLLGRRAELQWLVERAARPGLLVIKGPAGVGKTRLARELLLLVPDAAWFCNLTEARTEADVRLAIVATLGVELGEGGEQGATAHLGRALASRGRAVLIADNFEQVAPAGSGLLATLVDAAPELTVVVTSRERLGVQSEVCFDLAPLPADDAVALFVDRARRVRAHWTPEPDEREAIADLVRGLDGLPLAIELAASRTAILSVAEILTRLGERLDLFGADRRDDPARHHRTLREAIEWSWRLLGPEDRETLSTCSVFRGGFGLDAARGLLGEERLLDRLQSVCDRSLLWAGAAPGLAGETRYGMYETIRGFAAERLSESGREADVRVQHARVMVALATETSARTNGPEGAVWRRRLGLDRDNVTAVVERALDDSEPTAETVILATRAALALEPVVDITGSWTPWIEMLTEVRERLRRHDPRGATPLRARLDTALAGALLFPARVDEAAAILRAVLATPACEKDPSLRGMVLLQLGRIELHPDPDRASARLAAALDDARHAADLGLEGRVRARLAAAHHSWGRYGEAIEHAEAAVVALEACGDMFELSRVLNTVAVTHAETGNLEASLECAERATAISRVLGCPRVECLSVHLGATAAQERQEFARSRQLHERMIALAVDSADRLLEGIGRLYFGRLLHETGALDEALAEYDRAIEVLSGRELRLEPTARAARGAVLATQGDIEGAERELSKAETLAGATGRDRVLELVRIWSGHLDLSRARRSVAQHELSAADEHRAAAAARTEIVAHSEDARIALRVLQAAVAAAPSLRGVLCMMADCTRIVTPAGLDVDLARHRAPRGILKALAARDAARAPLGLEELFAAGWPGQRASPRSRKNRVQVALSTLRSLGLRDVIVSCDGGWTIDPSISITWL